MSRYLPTQENMRKIWRTIAGLNKLIEENPGGGGSVKSIAGVSPDEDGNVPLTAENINALSLTAFNSFIQPETLLFINNHISKGSFLTANEIQAVDSFYVKGKNSGWLSKLSVAWCPMGTNLSAALINLVSVGAFPEMVNNNFTEADYSPVLGFGVGSGTNTNKFLSTGLVPMMSSLSYNNISFGSFIPDNQATSNSWLMGLNGTVTSPIYIKTVGNVTGQDGVNNSANLVGGVGPVIATISYGPGRMNAYQNNALAINTTTPVYVAKNLDTEVTLFKSRTSYSNGRMSFFFMGSELSVEQNKSISDAILELSIALKRINLSGSVSLFAGDSIVQGTGATAGTYNRWSSKVALGTGTREFNMAKGSGELIRTPPSGNTSGITSLISKYRDVANFQFNNVFCEILTNDMNNNDSTTNGDATKIATAKGQYKAMVNYWKSLGLKVVLFAPPFNAVGGTTNDVKRRAYQQMVFEVADETGSLFVDTETVFTDTGVAASFFPDFLHPNDAGHSLIANLGISVFFGTTYRNLPIEFTSVAPNSVSAAVQVPIKGAKVGMPVTIGYVPVDGTRVFGYVSENNMVVVKAMNYTGAAVAIPSQFMKVTVQLF